MKWFTLLFLLLVGCAKESVNLHTSVHTLNGDELYLLVFKTNNIQPMNYLQRSDKEYLFPTKKWVEQDFSKAFKGFLKHIRNDRYIQESNDCEDFSSMAMVYAQLLNSNTPKEYEAALAFGVFDYIRDGDVGEGHSINIVIVYENNQFELLFYEPQTQKIIELSSWEKYNCLRIRF